MTNIFTDTQRAAVEHPSALTPRAAQEGGPDADAGDGGAGVDFFINLGIQIGNLANAIQADRDERESRIPPTSEPAFTAGVVNDNGDPLILDLGSVPLGRIWQVRRTIVGGPDVTQAVDGSAYWFRQGTAPTDFNVTNCVDIFSDLPRGNTYGAQELFMIATEHLWAVVVGGDAGQQYIASAFVEDWDYSMFTHSGH